MRGIGFSKRNIKSLFLFIFLIFNLYPVKISGINLSVFCNITLLIFSYSLGRSYLGASKNIFFLFSILLLLFSFFTFISTGNIELFLIGRNARILVSTILISLLFGKIVYSKSQFVNILKLVLIINVLVVLLQFIIPESKFLFANLVGYEKKLVPFRSFGLFTSYDFAGFYCLLSVLFFGVYKCNKFGKINKLALVLSIGSCFLTSRFTMLLCIIILIYLIYLNRLKIRFIHVVIGITMTFTFLIKYINLFIFVIAVSLPKFADIFNISVPSRLHFENSYGTASADVLLNKMVFVPDGYYLFFGTGIRPLESDIGYVHLLFLYGIIGMCLIFSSHIYIIRKGLSVLKGIKEIDLFKIYFIFSLLLFVYNYKLTFITGSGIYDFFMIFSLFIYFTKKKHMYEY